jgi:small subunit ribosomal protein S6
MAFYESVVIARPELTESQIENLISSLSKIISNEKGKVVKKENWGLRGLAYKIKKNKKGHYFMLNLDSNPSAIFEYERQMRINEDIIRFLTIKINEIDPKYSLMNINNDEDLNSVKKVEPQENNKKPIIGGDNE